MFYTFVVPQRKDMQNSKKVYKSRFAKSMLDTALDKRKEILTLLSQYETHVNNLKLELSEIDDFLENYKVSKEDLGGEAYYNASGTSDVEKYADYRRRESWTEKVLFVLENADKPLRQPEVIDEIIKYEDGRLDRDVIQRRIGNALWNMGDRGQIKKTEGVGGFSYSLKKS